METKFFLFMSHTQQTDNNSGWQGRERRASNKERNVVKSKDRDMDDRQDWAHGKGDSSGRWYSEVEKGSASEWKHERSCCHPSLMLLIRYWPAVCLLAPYQCLTLSDPTLIDCATALMLCVSFWMCPQMLIDYILTLNVWVCPYVNVHLQDMNELLAAWVT